MSLVWTLLYILSVLGENTLEAAYSHATFSTRFW